MPAYIASIVAVCIATSFTAANGEDAPQVASLQSQGSSFLTNPPVAYLVAAPVAGQFSNELRAQRARARAARQVQAQQSLRGSPYVPPNDQQSLEGAAISEGAEMNNRLGPASRATRARQRLFPNNMDLAAMTPTQLRDLKSFIHLAHGSSTGAISPFLAPIVPITAEDLARIQEHLLSDHPKTDAAIKSDPIGDSSDGEPERDDAAVVNTQDSHYGSGSSTTVIDRPVFVDRQGGPLVIIQQHAHHQEDETEAIQIGGDEMDAATAHSTDTPESLFPAKHDLEPVEYVPFALIDRDGRVAILERNLLQKPALGPPSDIEAPVLRADSPTAPKPLPAAIRKQIEEGRLPPPPFMFGAPAAKGSPWMPPFPMPSPSQHRSQEKMLAGENKEFYLAPAASSQRPSSITGQKFPILPATSTGQKATPMTQGARTSEPGSTPIIIRMPNSPDNGDGSNDWSPTALLLGKGPAPVRRTAETDKEDPIEHRTADRT
eukprot:Gregarina_sp_Poly_1__2088@NODE_154_length_12409_cov_137_944904_g136_i0_p2_GENE_NODE_154_length_12409_cov_137_944904_g136_i0NODE_154_length_12409_cov_137_944904_g136_i0_p2_ORF_typecomplete_len490_score66_29_NODE_154_length_12409_cov_137_944904_g136_i041925661